MQDEERKEEFGKAASSTRYIRERAAVSDTVIRVQRNSCIQEL